jgi:hypothetical protein
MDNCREEESHGPEFLKLCNTVANHFEIIGRPLHFKIKALKIIVDGSGNYKPLPKERRKSKENICDKKKRRIYK